MSKFRDMKGKEHPDGYWHDQQLIKGRWRICKWKGQRSVESITREFPKAKFRTERPTGEE